MPEFDPKALQVLADAENWLSYQGLHQMAEPKPGSLAVHWRGLDENAATELRSRILLGWFPIAERSSLTVLEFDGGVELRIPDRDKSDAIQTILQEVGRGTPVAYLGDDLSDEPAFRALQGRGLTVLVRREKRKTAAQAWLKPPEELLDFLVRWRDACRATTMAVPRVVPPRPPREGFLRGYPRMEGTSPLGVCDCPPSGYSLDVTDAPHVASNSPAVIAP